MRQMIPMMQLSLAKAWFLPKAGKQTRKTVFLAEMRMVAPWSRLEALIAPLYPKNRNGRLLMSLGAMLRIHFVLHWFGYSNSAMEEALHDMPLLHQFAGLDEDVISHESAILRFRHLVEKHDMDAAIFAAANAVLLEKSLSMKRDPERMQTKKGNKWHFGMKARIGVDADSGLIHTVEGTTAKIAGIAMMEKYLHVEEAIAFGDHGYCKKSRTNDKFHRKGNVSVLTSTKKPAGGVLTKEQSAFSRMLSWVQAIVEPPFRIVKRQFGFVKVCYRGLTKNTGQTVTLFALANLWLARKRLLPLVGDVRP